MKFDSDPPRLSEASSQDGALLRTALQQARSDMPGPETLARLATRLPLGPGPSGAPPNSTAVGGGGAVAASPSLSAPMLSSIAIGAAAGIVASFLLWVADPDAATPEPPDPPSTVLAVPSELPRPSASSSKPAEPMSTVGVEPGVRGSNAAPVADSETEASLLDRARAQIASNPNVALSLAARHRTRFPKGHLGQEREFIAVSALVALGRATEACLRAEALLAANPQSAHRRRLTELVPCLASDQQENP